MNLFKSLVGLLFITCILLAPEIGFAQITSDAGAVVPTEYSSGPQDNIHIFCGIKSEINALLTATAVNNETANFEWTRYNGSNFDFFKSESGINSTITQLVDGCYQVTVTSATEVKIYTAWVFNNYLEVTAEIPSSDCNSFTLAGTVNSPKLIYTDLTTGLPKELINSYAVSWSVNNKNFSSFATQPVYSPPTKNTVYTFEVTDRFSCVANTDIEYISIVTKASFDYVLEGQDKKSDASRTEAPLTVSFTNTSENGDPGKYEWFIFKDLQKIKEEVTAGTFEDSIKEKVISDNLVYTFEECGSYMVKLVSKKMVSDILTCTDTFYMADYIVADTSFIEAPNVFTPNGDGTNDKFAIKFFSMKSVKVTILNRWGKVIHVWESNNVQGFLNTAETVPESVWDGKVGGRYASPGVYYYVVEGTGRDGKRRKESGFFHLFRDK